MPTLNWLPKFESYKCDNPDCEAQGRYPRVLSKKELDRVYPKSSSLPHPAPPQATHMCDYCGRCYGDYRRESIDPDREYEDYEEDWEWELKESYSLSVRENVDEFLDQAPDGIEGKKLVSITLSNVPGADRSVVVDRMQDRGYSVSVKDITEFM